MEDDSIEVFYKELLHKILEDPFDNSYAEFQYEFKKRNKLFDAVQKYLGTKENPFYNSFMAQNPLYNIKIKELRFIECYEKSVPAKGGKYLSRYVVKFTILYEKNL
jgi:hypothetical protein